MEERMELVSLSRHIDTPDLKPLPDSWAAKYEQIVGQSWESYKLRHKPEIKTMDQDDDDEFDEDDFNNLDHDDQIPDVKPEPKEEDSDIEIPLRNRNFSSNSEAFSETSRSRNSSSGQAHSRKDIRVNLSNILDANSARKEFIEMTRSLRPSSSESMSNDKSFVGLKFNRSHSGRWSAASLKREAEEIGDGGHHNEKRIKIDNDFDDDTSDDEDFSLADVGGNNDAVQRMMLENDEDEEDDDDAGDEEDDELRFSNPSRLSLDTFDHRYNPSPGLLSGDNGLGAILDFDRGAVQTPEDLKNLTGLLDSMDQDPHNSML